MRAQCRTRLLPAAKLTHNQMRSAEARSRQSSLPLLPLPIPQMMHILISRHLLMQNEIKIIPIKENLQATVLQPLTSARGCQHTSQADPRLRGGKVTSRETFGLANAHLVACILVWPPATMPIPPCSSSLKMKHDRICIQLKAFHFSDILLHFAALWVGRPGR